MRRSLQFIYVAFLATSLLFAFLGSAHAFDSVALRDYQMQLMTDPEVPIAGKPTTVTIKVLRLDGEPARGGKIFVTSGDRVEDMRIKGLSLEDMDGHVEAVEVDGFGNYEFTTTFATAEQYYIKVAVLEMDGDTFAPPLRAGFNVTASAPEHRAARMWLVLASFVLLTAGAAYIIYRRSKTPSSDPAGFNLLDLPVVRNLLTSRWLQTLFQVPLLLGFAVLIFLAFADIQDGGRNLATKSIWTIWWAGIIFTFVFVGRVWCYMCPVGALSEWTARLVDSSRRFPPALRNVWLANAMFVLLTWLDVQLGVVRSPLVTGWLLVGVTVLAVVIALFYERRTFCRYLCPIGGVIGIYSMFSAIELRAKNCETCRGHKVKECYLGSDNGRGCPMFELLPTMDSNNACNFCGECIRSCSRDNITIRLRTFFKDAWASKRLSLDEAALAMVLVGVSIFVTGDMLEPWRGWMERAMAMVPASLLGIRYEYTIEVVTKSFLYFSTSLVLIPALLLAASLLSNRLVALDERLGVRRTFVTFAYMFIPIGLSLHLAHNAGHLFNESEGIVPAFQRAVNTYTPFYLGEPRWQLAAAPLIDGAFLYWIQMGILAVMYLFSLLAGYRLSMNSFGRRDQAFRALAPMALLSFVFMMVNVFLLNLPMAPRHIH